MSQKIINLKPNRAPWLEAMNITQSGKQNCNGGKIDTIIFSCDQSDCFLSEEDDFFFQQLRSVYLKLERKTANSQMYLAIRRI